MVWLLTGVTAILFVEVVLALSILPRLAALTRVARQARRVVASRRISDHWKEKTLVVYAGRLLRDSLTMAVLLVLAVALLATWSVALADPLAGGFITFALSAVGTAFATLFALAYVFVRSRLVAHR